MPQPTGFDGLSVDFASLFNVLPTPILVVAVPDWIIVAANDARLKVTGTTREEQIGRKLFDVFPDDPDDPEADGVRNLTASLQRVVATREADAMAVQRYSVRGPDGLFVQRWWSPVNTPVLDQEGRVALIVHHVEDVTEVIRLRVDAQGQIEHARGQQLLIDRLRGTSTALRESEARRATALSIARLGTFEWEPSSGEVVLDERAREMFGFAADEALTATEVFARVHPDDLPEIEAKATAAASEGGHLEMDCRLLLSDGSTRIVTSLSGSVFGVDGKARRTAGVFADVTERSRAEAALMESEARFRNMADNAPVMMWVTDPTGYCTHLNARWYEFTGQAAGSGEAYGWLDAVHPEDRPSAEAAFVAANAEHRDYQVDFRLRRADGVYRWTIDAAAARFDDAGTFLGYVGSVIDIDERREAEQRLALSQEQLRLATDLGEIGEWDVDQLTGAVFWPPRVRAMFGISSDEAVTLQDFNGGLHPDDREATRAAYEAAVDSDVRAPYNVEYRTVGKEDGVVRWVAAKGRGLFDANGACYRVIGTAIDITIRKADELQLRELNERLEQEVSERTAERNRIWEMSRELLAIVGFDGQLKAINPAWTAALGREAQSLLSLPAGDGLHPDDQTAAKMMGETLRRGETVERFEARHRHADGSWRWVSWTLVPEGDIVFAVGRDVTVEKDAAAELGQAQEALRQSQKMEAMGSLTGGVAHDFNNLLTPIVGSLDLLQRKGLGGEREQRLIAGAIQSADRAKTLVQRLLAFARRQPLQPTAVDVGGLVQGMADLLASTTGPQVHVVVEVADDLPPAKADANQLEMALLNLGVNARDAMPDGGTLRITATRESVRSPTASLARGHYVRLSVADTGVGMDEATRARAVEPFFSTKGIGKGTGLGLSMAHGLAAQLGGVLTIESKPGLGTNIELWLPISSILPGEEEVPVASGILGDVRGIALLVDDEDIVRESTGDMLEEFGYEVRQANSGEAALKLVAQGLSPTLLITDHLMPGMTGVDLARTLRENMPDLPVLIVSGYAEAEGVAPDLPRLTKPFKSAELEARLAALAAGVW